MKKKTRKKRSTSTTRESKLCYAKIQEHKNRAKQALKEIKDLLKKTEDVKYLKVTEKITLKASQTMLKINQLAKQRITELGYH